MQTKTLVILGGLTVAALVGAGLTLDRGAGRPAPESAAGGPLVPGLLARVNDVAELEVVSAKGTATVRRGEAGRWVLPQKDGYPADPNEVKAAVVGLAEAKILEARTALPDLYERIGVQEPDAAGSTSNRVTLKAADGAALASVIFGKRATGGGGSTEQSWYVRRSGEAASWLMRAPLETVESDPMRWVDRAMPRLARERVMAVEVRQPDGSLVTLSRDTPAAKDFAVAGLPEGAKAKASVVEETAGALAYPTFEDVAKADDSWFADGTVATFRSFDGLVVTVRSAMRGNARWLTVAVAFDAERAKASAGLEASGLLKPDAAEAQAKEWAARHAGWAYRVYEALGDDFARPPAAFVEPPA